LRVRSSLFHMSQDLTLPSIAKLSMPLAMTQMRINHL